MRALITGITGQDGSHLADLLVSKGYEVWGLIRRTSVVNAARIEHLYRDPHEPESQLHLVYGDLADQYSLLHALEESSPDEIYHLGAQSHVRLSFDMPDYTANITGLGTQRMLLAARMAAPKAKFYNAASSEMFGGSPAPQHEHSHLTPRSPYACAKVFAYTTALNDRAAYNQHIVNGILFNHEGPRRGRTFVTRKISETVAKIKLGLARYLYLGNLQARRDWGYAVDYVEGMWRMMQTEKPGDYVLATGVSHSVQDFVEQAFQIVNLDWHDHVRHSPRYERPTEVELLCGNYDKAHRELGWSPTVDFPTLVHLMVSADLRELSK